jgi:hypothetical protein
MGAAKSLFVMICGGKGRQGQEGKEGDGHCATRVTQPAVPILLKRWLAHVLGIVQSVQLPFRK